MKNGGDMFFIRLIQMFLGYTNFRAYGARCEKFLNLAAKSGILLWNLKRDETDLIGCVLSSKYKELIKIAAKSGVAVTAEKRKGLPAYLGKLKRRLGFVVGAALFAAVMIYFSGFVWSVKVTGNSTVSTREIMYALDDLGLSPGIRKNTFDRKSIEQQATLKIPELSWLHINLNGCVATVKVGERSKRPEEVPYSKPCNIKALETGQIIKIEVYEGRAVLKKGDTVKKNELIVSGVMEEPQTTITRYVHAEAKVIAETSHRISVTVPLENTVIKDTENEIKKYSIDFLNISAPLYFNIPHGSYRRLVYKSPLVIAGNKLPISFRTTVFSEYKTGKVLLSREQALKKAKNELTTKEKSEFSGMTVKSRVYRRKNSSNCVTVTGDYKCEENIAVSSEVKIGDTGGNGVLFEEGK